jgi:septal ring factor EnvC (AmiA/AmiB activator)
MNPPPCYQEMCKMVKVKTEQLEKATERIEEANDRIEEAKTNEMELIRQLQRVSDASKVFQHAYLRISTENSILEEKIRKLEGKM